MDKKKKTQLNKESISLEQKWRESYNAQLIIFNFHLILFSIGKSNYYMMTLLVLHCTFLIINLYRSKKIKNHNNNNPFELVKIKLGSIMNI